jgi:Glutathione peroxidase
MIRSWQLWLIFGAHDPSGYMLHHCKEACDQVHAAASADLEAIAAVKSFFDLSANDIDGNLVSFETFRGQVTVLVNVASYCGYTESHYQGLVELWGHVKDEPVNILAFPCNQFGTRMLSVVMLL